MVIYQNKIRKNNLSDGGGQIETKVNFQEVFQQVTMWDAIIFNFLKDKGIVIPKGLYSDVSDFVSVRVLKGKISSFRKSVSEKDFLDSVNKVIKGYKKFSSTPKYMVYN